MDQNIKEKWVAALRSGEYEQCVGRLCRVFNGKKCYCVMGVLADVIRKERPELATWSRSSDPHIEQFKYGNVYMEAALTDDILESIGINRPNFGWICIGPYPNENSNPCTLILLNDTYELDFNQLADIIEQRL